jgi:raffinose/stachyose/melibiose transport system permease protein
MAILDSKRIPTPRRLRAVLTPRPVEQRRNLPATAVMAIASLSIVLPLLLAVGISMQTPADLARPGLTLLPTTVNLDNYLTVFKKVNYGQALLVSVFVTVVSVILVVFTNTLIGYVMARNMHLRFVRFGYYYLIVSLFVPFQIIMLPLVKLLYQVGITGIPALILGYVVFGLPQNIFLTVGYLKTVPRDLEEAATLDGANFFQVYRHVLFPLLRPISATIAVFTMLLVWNDFLLPLLLLRNEDELTLPLIQFTFQSQFQTDYGVAFASYLMALAPLVIFYVFAQRWVVGGLMNGATK